MSKGKDWRGLTKNVEVRIWWWRWYGFYYVGTDTCILRCACTNIFILSPAAPSRRLFLWFRPSIKADYDISTYITYMHFRYVWSNADKRQPVITTINELSEKTSTVRTVVYQDIEVNLFQQDLYFLVVVLPLSIKVVISPKGVRIGMFQIVFCWIPKRSISS